MSLYRVFLVCGTNRYWHTMNHFYQEWDKGMYGTVHTRDSFFGWAVKNYDLLNSFCVGAKNIFLFESTLYQHNFVNIHTRISRLLLERWHTEKKTDLMLCGGRRFCIPVHQYVGSSAAPYTRCLERDIPAAWLKQSGGSSAAQQSIS